MPAGLTKIDLVTRVEGYDTGTFTPTLVGSSVAGTPVYTSQTGVYTKIGRIVHFTVRLAWSSLGSLAGNVTIPGMPFAHAGIASRSGTEMTYWNGVNWSAVNADAVSAKWIMSGGSNLTPLLSRATSAATNVTEAELTAAGEIYISGTYTATA